MDAALKSRLNALARQLDKDQQRALKGELEAVLKRYERELPKKPVSKRKLDQFERVSEKFNDWVDSEIERKGEYVGLQKMTKGEKYNELHKSGAVPRKETRTADEIVNNSINPKQAIDHAINRMKRLMTKQGQKEKFKMAKEAFAQAFNLPGGGVLDKQLRKELRSMTQEEWEIFNVDNKQLIAMIWDEYHKLMEKLADPNYMLGRKISESMPSMLLENVLSEIKNIKEYSEKKKYREDMIKDVVSTITRGLI